MTEQDRPVACANCEWTGVEAECAEMPVNSILERVSPGEIMPVGECPECGAVAHYSDDAVISNRLLQEACGLLNSLVERAPDEEPDLEDYDDTESASSKGVDVGLWESAQVAKQALGKLVELDRLLPALTPSELN